MDNKTNLFEPLLERVEEFGKTSYQILRLKTLDKTADVVSNFVSRVVAFIVLCIGVIAINIGVAYWLGNLMGKLHYGFFCVAGFNILIGLILYFFMHNWIKKLIANSIISKMFD